MSIQPIPVANLSFDIVHFFKVWIELFVETSGIIFKLSNTSVGYFHKLLYWVSSTKFSYIFGDKNTHFSHLLSAPSVE